ncbi:hypothetical protein T260_12860 [Geobacillus thermopakistaniensis]|uniref:Uncharacterized protein n=1 Tax=Geobacillus thermopakistaniensis (strain MAS1) TaxID=1408282 RepID=A0A7U9P5P6_GEOTM|nr:hypothetical protein T260_12860 [Geobacillus sp. MAS1]
MMKTPLNISMMLERAELFFPKKQVFGSFFLLKYIKI